MDKILNDFKVIDLSGYSFSGKSAYFDLLCEFEGYNYHSREFEFELVRISDGILDLYNALVENWSPVRSSEAIRKFKRLIRVFGGNDKFSSRLLGRGYKYDYYFKDFSKISEKLLEQLVNASWKSEWPFAYINYPLYRIILKKILFRLGKKNIFESEVFLSRFEKDEFLSIIRDYFDMLIRNNMMKDKDKALILNNAFETTDPSKSHSFFYHAKSIIVDRDPRDIYLSALKNGSVGGVNVGKTAIGNNVDDFIYRFKLYRKDLKTTENVLRINFENLVMEYDKTLSRIFSFLGEESSVHIYPKKYFNPDISKKGVGMWKNVGGQLKKDIEKIYFELKDYCLDI